MRRKYGTLFSQLLAVEISGIVERGERTTPTTVRPFPKPDAASPGEATTPKANIMIRETRLFCKLLELRKTAQELYEEEKAEKPGRCPVCGCRGRWARHGWYERNLIDYKGGKTEYARIRVRRVRCESCGHTHAILPDYIVPYSTYSLLFILLVLWEHLMKRRTVEGICQRYSITPSMLYQWKKLFDKHKGIWLGVLGSIETTGAEFIQRLVALPDYRAMFAIPFFQKAARSFLQGHRDAARYRQGVL